MLFTMVSFLAAITVLVFVHELGHYLVAKALGVKIVRFSIGFGKPFFSVMTKKGEEWCVGWLPLGGYVKMLESSSIQDGMLRGSERGQLAFDTLPPRGRILIAFAGPLFNLIFAVAAWAGVAMLGVYEPLPILGETMKGSVVATAGFKKNDLAVAVDGRETKTIPDFFMALVGDALSADKRALVTVERDGGKLDMDLDLSGVTLDERKDVFSELGWKSIGPSHRAEIGGVTPGGVAERAGLLQGDVFLALNGQPVDSWEEVVSAISSGIGQPIDATVLRSGSERHITVIPAPVPLAGKKVGRIGISLAPDAMAGTPKVQYSFMQAIPKGADMAWQNTVLSIKAISSLGSTGASVSGPIGIADKAGKSASAGKSTFLSFLAMISLSLAIMNLIPLPVLDGGHIVLSFIEMLRGKPLPDKVLQIANSFGVYALVSLMFVAVANDLSKLFW